MNLGDFRAVRVKAGDYTGQIGRYIDEDGDVPSDIHNELEVCRDCQEDFCAKHQKLLKTVLRAVVLIHETGEEVSLSFSEIEAI